MTDDDLENSEAWLNAVESMIALLAAQLPAAARMRFVAALRELEATGPELNARLSWSAALQRVRLLIGDDDEKSTRSDEPSSPTMTTRSARIEQFIVDQDAPESALAALLCEDHVGTYTIPFPCRRSDGAWLNGAHWRGDRCRSDRMA